MPCTQGYSVACNLKNAICQPLDQLLSRFGGAETAKIDSHPITQSIDSPLLSRCTRKSFLSIEIRCGPEGDGGSDRRSECEVEGGVRRFGTGSRGRRTLGVLSVIYHGKHIQGILKSDCPHPWRPMGPGGRGDAYRGGLVQGLTGETPEGHAAQDSTCQHTEDMKNPPIKR